MIEEDAMITAPDTLDRLLAEELDATLRTVEVPTTPPSVQSHVAA